MRERKSISNNRMQSVKDLPDDVEQRLTDLEKVAIINNDDLDFDFE